MNSSTNNRTESVCKFGPGGDFVSVWPGESEPSSQPAKDGLSRLLVTLGEIISSLLGSGVRPQAPGPRSLKYRIIDPKEKSGYTAKIAELDKPAYSPVRQRQATAKSNSLLSIEPRLFTDDWRAGIRAGRKPKHRIRAFRRTVKKRHAAVLSEQGSLFETNFKSAKTA